MDEVRVMKSWKWMSVLVLAAILAVGCGGDDDDDDMKTDESSAGKGGGGSAAPKDAGTAGMDDTEVACGKVICKPEEGETATLCCFDEFSAKCGMKQGMSGQTCVMRVTPDSRCPSATGMGGGFTLPSCCTADNMCGINASVFTGGSTCTELGEAQMDAMERGAGNFIMIPDPQACE
jgi:hypothetical protein